ncbi:MULTISPECIES: acyl-CoA thioesterase [Sphingobium]|jgi:acyl-CoA thioesterase YciA|uniref:Acyl-CoA thioesterase n=1 Tax=Sphingobium yanoikuyae TaxID=13690 RepID=A0A084ETF5_SPHYA|nr:MULTISPECIES: acyl-CoA thioesterase [Sphingobium]KEZ21247.1 Cytosolic long-chain acyl-CoA thioester hydrolase family protein [Sphingobium yanoikuyae]KFD26419.1 acyl-CoA thioester hydrolase [Sphingobium yanoikuyae]KZC80449.1 acyl-CoA thioesterase [Sphingobium yanoikuyae]MBR2268526.1 acyl-CoA thioesterase [Sphingobium sp.]MBT2243839.1 acyl-CoA thioesterase [Sphingobium sp. BHU LFT2]
MAKIDEQPPEHSPAVRVIAMPADTNPHGDIFGGWLMSLMDSAAGSVAARYSHGRAVTIAVEGMTFHRPVIVGDEVSVFAMLKSVGRTSMKIDVEAWRRARHDDRSYRVTQATFTFVAIGEDRQPRSVPPLPAQ